jgi:acetyl-CoA carboxylase carboxyltransferase component
LSTAGELNRFLLFSFLPHQEIFRLIVFFIKLGFKKELEAEETEEKKKALFDKLVARMYEVGKATEAAAHLEMDAVIDPASTRETILKAFKSCRPDH